MKVIASGAKLMFPFMGCLGLAACGGSGGNSATPTALIATAPPPPAGPVEYNTAEYRHNYGLAQINAITAYENGATGAGITVAVIDSGIDIDHPELEANIHADSTNIVTGRKADLNDIDGHGTAVSGVIAAVRDPINNSNVNVHGVAFDAKILALNAASTGSCESADGCSFYDSDIAEALDYARIRGVKVVNISLGGDDFNTPYLVGAYQRAVDAGMLIVIAAGNRDDTDTDANLLQPENSASAAWADWANGQIIVAGAVDSSGSLAGFSHKAGAIAKDVYLVAPGDRILTPGEDGQYFYYSGTSFSTPHIAGAAALLMSAFPNLTGKTTVELLFDTATDLGALGHDNVYGGGLINLAEAFQPQGTSSVAVRTAAGETETVALEQSVLLGGAAFGSLATFSAAVGDAMLLDGYDRSFQVDLGQQIFQAGDPLRLATLVQSGNGSRRSDLKLSQQAQVAFSWREDEAFREVDETYFSHRNQDKNRTRDLRAKLSLALGEGQQLIFGQGHSLKETLEDYDGNAFLTIGKGDILTLMKAEGSQTAAFERALGPKTRVTWAASHGAYEWDQYQLRAASYMMLTRIDHALTRNLNLGLDLGLLTEKGSVLGSMSGGAIRLGEGANTNFVTARLGFAVTDNLSFFTTASFGATRVKRAAFSLVESISNLTTSSFAIGMVQTSLFQDGDRLSLAVSQPLRVQGGLAQVSRVADRDYITNSLSFSASKISLAPEGRQIDIEVAYQLGRFFGADMTLNALHQINPSHDRLAADNNALLLRLGSSF